MGWKDWWIMNFTKSKVDSKFYYKVEDVKIMILLLYVDDLFLIGKEILIIECYSANKLVSQ